MPTHDGVWPDEGERGSPTPPRCGQPDPEQSVPGPGLALVRWSVSVRSAVLLHQVFKNQFAVSAAGQREAADDDKKHPQTRGQFCGFIASRINPQSVRDPDCGEQQVTKYVKN